MELNLLGWTVVIEKWEEVNVCWQARGPADLHQGSLLSRLQVIRETELQWYKKNCSFHGVQLKPSANISEKSNELFK